MQELFINFVVVALKVMLTSDHDSGILVLRYQFLPTNKIYTFCEIEHALSSLSNGLLNVVLL